MSHSQYITLCILHHYHLIALVRGFYRIISQQSDAAIVFCDRPAEHLIAYSVIEPVSVKVLRNSACVGGARVRIPTSSSAADSSRFALAPPPPSRAR